MTKPYKREIRENVVRVAGTMSFRPVREVDRSRLSRKEKVA